MIQRAVTDYYDVGYLKEYTKVLNKMQAHLEKMDELISSFNPDGSGSGNIGHALYKLDMALDKIRQANDKRFSKITERTGKVYEPTRLPQR